MSNTKNIYTYNHFKANLSLIMTLFFYIWMILQSLFWDSQWDISDEDINGDYIKRCHYKLLVTTIKCYIYDFNP